MFNPDRHRSTNQQSVDRRGTTSMIYLRVPDIDATCVHSLADRIEESMAFFKSPEGCPLAIMSVNYPSKP